MARFPKSTEVQTLLFDKSVWTITDAKKWLKDHGYKAPAPDGKGEYHRFRQYPPFRFKKGTFRTIVFGAAKNGIKAVIGVPREKQNPKKTKRVSRLPSLLVDLADARKLELEDGNIIKFPLKEKWALTSNKKGDELWIVSRAGGKKVATEDQQAERLFEKFTGFEAVSTGDLVQLPEMHLKRVGRAKSIIYRSDKFSNKANDYIHAFKHYPTVSVDNQKRPKIVCLRGGRIKVTAEGITG